MATPTTNTRTAGQPQHTAPATIAEVVAALDDVFGRLLTAQIAGGQDASTIDDLTRGAAEPDDEVTQRLRTALSIADLLLEVERPSVVRVWFGGQNRMLGDRPPALVLGTDSDAVWRAARAFRAYG